MMLRRLVLILLMCVLPLQAFAAAAMMHCQPQAASCADGACAGAAHDHAAGTAAHAHDDDLGGHAQAAPDADHSAQAAAPDHDPSDRAPAGKLAGCSDCGHCAVCSPALSPLSVHVPPPADPRFALPLAALAPVGEYAPLLRPPRLG
ncbi:hypothetical protein [Chitinilyticum litopenaei]|uniref:hypothetical protein n=1 Tax=Chitinilyticum litopenaei TaxID=1121276 RepID=UPI000415EA0F|nr:hypothetical protein [Chitinilyticum litopenaei]